MDDNNSTQEPSGERSSTDAAELLRLRMDRAEALIVELRAQAAEALETARSRPAGAAGRDELKNAELRISDVAAGLETLKRTFAREGELAARLEAAEGSLAEVKTVLEGQRVRLRAELDALAPRDAVDALRVSAASAAAALDEIKLNFAQYSAELDAARSECRKALGEAQGLAKVAAQNQAGGQLDAFVRESVGKMGARLAELETVLHAGLSEFSARFSANEVLYNKMFSAAEERLKKGLEPQLKNMEGQIRWLRENLLRLSDDYTVVAERKLRALEAKYDAFEAMARRLETIDAALKKSGKTGLP